MFQLEGTEDIDCIKQKDERSHFTHVQLKYSVNKQNASFLHGVLEKFLEASNKCYQKVGFEIRGSLYMVGFDKN